MLDAGAAARLLIEQGLLDPAEVVRGEVRLIDVSRRNRNFHVIRTREPSYVVKQGLGSERRATIAHEAAIHNYLSTFDSKGLKLAAPRKLGYLAAGSVLILERVAGAESLETHHRRNRRLSTRHARALALALSTLHRSTTAEQDRARYRKEVSAECWTPPDFARPSARQAFGFSNGGLLALRMIQSTGDFCERLQAAVQPWHPCCLIHGDLRFDNCLIAAAGGAPVGRVTLVDWELSSIGDPCWDVGTVIASYLTTWLLACPITGEAAVPDMLALGSYKLADMQRAVGAFLAAYAESVATVAGLPELALTKVMGFAAVSIVQTLFEDLQESAELTARAVCLAQLAFNILSRPEDAAARLVALPIAA